MALFADGGIGLFGLLIVVGFWYLVYKAIRAAWINMPEGIRDHAKKKASEAALNRIRKWWK